MKYILKKPYSIRGWLRMPYVLHDFDANRNLKKLCKEEADFLIACDGKTELPENNFAKKFLDEQIIKKSENNEDLDQFQRYFCHKNRNFKTVQWAITGRCNYKCKHCFMTEGTQNSDCEFLLRECVDIIDQIAECGFEEVYLTGGEPLLHPNFFEIIDKFVEKNINISVISTNGALVDENFINQIKKHKINPSFCISYDGIGHHDFMRGIKGAEEASLNAIKLLRSAGFNAICESCWHKGNISVLPKTAELMESLGVSYFKVFRTAESPRWLLNGGKDKSLSFKEYYDACLELIRAFRKQRWNMDMKLTGVYIGSNSSNSHRIFNYFHDLTRNENENNCVCPKARGILNLAHDGRVLQCNPFSGTNKLKGENFGNIKQTRLQELLTDSQYLSFVTSTVNDLYEHNQKCRNCQFNKKCLGGCRALAYGFTGDFYGIDESKCYFFEHGYDKKIEDIVMKA
jgi:radical SAM protein with 4Fe4S-binding SPASM domain